MRPRYSLSARNGSGHAWNNAFEHSLSVRWIPTTAQLTQINVDWIRRIVGGRYDRYGATTLSGLRSHNETLDVQRFLGGRRRHHASDGVDQSLDHRQGA